MFLRIFMQLLESLKREGLRPTIRKCFYFRKTVFLVSKNLAFLEPTSVAKLPGDLQFFDVTDRSFAGLNPQFPLKSRQYKATEYLNRNYGGFVLMEGKAVAGDMWFVTSRNSNQKVLHHDLRWLGLKNTFTQKDAYLFDIYVAPEKRKNFVAVALFRESLYALKDKVISKVYCYVLADDVPAVSLVVGLFKFDIEKQLKICRLGFYIFRRNL